MERKAEMSGGVYYHAYSRIQQFADTMALNTLLRRELRELLWLVADAMHDVEWVDSGDWREGDEDEAIRKCFRELPEGLGEG